jgi:hypothetical protein
MQRRFCFTLLSRLAIVLAFSSLAVTLSTDAVLAADQQEAWRPLFNGKDFSGWTNAAGKAPGRGWAVAEGAMFRKDSAGDIWTKERFGNFVLDLESKTEGNSGIFIRTGNPGDCVQTGIEIQVYKPVGKPSKHSCGAVYDALAPTKDMVKANAWNHVVITANDNRLEVVMNGEKIIDMDIDRWTTPGQNPDGTKNKYHKALKDFPREGHIGLQDHGAKVSYRNLKIRVQ